MSKTCLVIDDDRIMLMLISTAISKAGYTALTAASAGDALEILKNQPVDLMTCDLMMPEISGLDLLERLKQDESYAKIPVVIVSAAGYSEQLNQATALGAAAVITKPFSVLDLQKTIHTLLGESTNS